jgi:hypothetical protein
MKKPVLVGLGALIALIGAVWTLQGLNILGGSAMSGVTMWAVIGPVVFLVGLALILTGNRRGSSGS